MSYTKSAAGELVVSQPVASALQEVFDFEDPFSSFHPVWRGTSLVFPADESDHLLETLTMLLGEESDADPYADEFHFIYSDLVHHPDTPPQALRILALHGDAQVRVGVATHPRVETDTLLTLVDALDVADLGEDLAETIFNSSHINNTTVGSFITFSHWTAYPYLIKREDVVSAEERAVLAKVFSVVSVIDPALTLLPPGMGYVGDRNVSIEELAYLRLAAADPTVDFTPHRVALALELWRSYQAVPSASAFAATDWDYLGSASSDPFRMLDATEREHGRVRTEVAYALWLAAAGFSRSPLFNSPAAKLAEIYRPRFEWDAFTLFDTVSTLSGAISDTSWSSTPPTWELPAPAPLPA